MENSILLKIEIVVLALITIYLLYYMIYFSLKSSRKLRSILGVSKNKKVDVTKQFRVNVEKSDESNVKEHSKNKQKLNSGEKLKISELMKKIKINIAKREFDIAKNLIVEWLTIDKFHTELNLELANIYIEEDEYIKAEYIYKDLILVHSEDVVILKKLWYVLSIQEKYALAIEMYKKAHRLDKDDGDICNMLTQLTFYVGDYLGAIKYGKKYLKIKPKHVETMQILASAHEKTQNSEKALQIYEAIAELKPYDEEILRQIERLKNDTH